MGEDVRKAIDAVFQGYLEGLRRGDVGAVVSSYAEDAVQLPPNADIVHGRKRVKEFTEATVQRGFVDAILTERELTVSGDVAYEIGQYTEKFRPKGKERSEIKGKYLLVFKRTADGWKIHREIWNSPRASRGISSI